MLQDVNTGAQAGDYVAQSTGLHLLAEEIMSMERSRRRQTKIQAYAPKLDVEEFNKLTDLLFEVFKENSAACARALGISRVTWKRWEKDPPQWPFWNLVIRHVIKSYLPALASRRGISRQHHQRIIKQLAELRDADSLGEEIGNLAYEAAGAETHLRRLLSRKGMYWHEIRAVANAGGFTSKSLRKAARAIGVVKTQEGYGDRKRSYWRLPDHDDD
jgi:hypothetical protein